MSKPMHRTYEVSRDGRLRPNGRISERELLSWGYKQTDASLIAADAETIKDQATLWKSPRGEVSDLWVGEEYQGCDTCGCPQDEHNGQRRVLGVSLGSNNARAVCETFS